MLCEKCGYSNIDDSRYCAICGNGSDREPTESRVDVGSVPCPSCGFLNEEIATYCRSCGKKMKAKRKKAARKQAPPEPPLGQSAESPVENTVEPPMEQVVELPVENAADTPAELPEEAAPSVEEEELAVLFGLNEPDASDDTAKPEAAPEEDTFSDPSASPEAVASTAPTDNEETVPVEAEPLPPVPGEDVADMDAPTGDLPAEGEQAELDELAKLVQEVESSPPDLEEPEASVSAETLLSADGGGAASVLDETDNPETSGVSEEPEALVSTDDGDMDAPTGDLPAEGEQAELDELAKLVQEMESSPPDLEEPEASVSAETVLSADGDSAVSDLDETDSPAVPEEIELPSPLSPSPDEPEAFSVETTEPAEPEADSKVEGDLSTYISTPHESVEAVIPDEPEGDGEDSISGSEADDQEESAKIAAMAGVTKTLNSLIKDLLDVEITEAGGADSINVTEGDFPSRDKRQHWNKTSGAAIRARFSEAAGYFVTTAAFLLSGLSIGLWLWYLLS